ncbi:MAG: hypothetical protein DRI56_11175 [Chloroflexota bacterium]|nr:MAG: hypothetical protein DRI56_11175 [Chloroflexota bacterium]
MSTSKNLSRRDFLKLSALGLGSLALRPWTKAFTLGDFPDSERLGRVCVGKVHLRIRPDYDSQTVAVLYEDAVVPWLREVVGHWPGRNNQRWIETPQGYIWAPYLQPVVNQPNDPVNALLIGGDNPGMWVEVTIPWVNVTLDNDDPQSPWLKHQVEKNLPIRFYYSQVLWVDQIKTGTDGNIWYRVNERYGNPGDIFWAPAQAFRVIMPEEVTPITPEVEDKRIEIDVNYSRQFLSCYEGNTEVYFCRISSGRGKNSTPLSAYGAPGYPIWRKLFSVHMAGGSNEAGWDLSGIGWTSFFVGDGVAIHSTFWHNNFGEPTSHGCVNVSPEDAKWIFRWTHPAVPFETGDVTISGEGSTRIIVKEW